MNLPTSNQVLAATRHVASFAAGAIAMFGLSTKINPDQVVALINSAGTAVNDIIVLIGLATPFITSYFAAHSASPTSQIKAVDALPEVVGVVTMPTAGGRALAQAAESPTVAVSGSAAATSITSK